jgi:hypothetical protein
MENGKGKELDVISQIVWALGHSLAPNFARHLADRVRLSTAPSCLSVFPSDNHVVRFGAVSPELPDILRVTAHGSFDGHAVQRSTGWE